MRMIGIDANISAKIIFRNVFWLLAPVLNTSVVLLLADQITVKNKKMGDLKLLP